MSCEKGLIASSAPEMLRLNGMGSFMGQTCDVGRYRYELMGVPVGLNGSIMDEKRVAGRRLLDFARYGNGKAPVGLVFGKYSIGVLILQESKISQIRCCKANLWALTLSSSSI